ncbi:MAG: hypothetical protein KDC44_21980, partial [Phaeodactylibacter sp.]|nr:hypothetical protein [Phaeodactylibacter sp.]
MIQIKQLLATVVLCSLISSSFSKTPSHLFHFLQLAKWAHPSPICTPAPVTFFGEPTVYESCQAIIEGPGSTAFIAGTAEDDKSYLAQIDASFQVLWSKTFDFSTATEEIRTILLDADGHLICSGFSATVGGFRTAFLFRYDYQTDQLLWSRSVTTDPTMNRSAITKVFESPTNSNHLWAIGQTWPNGTDNCDATFWKINKLDGSQLSITNINHFGCDNFLGGTIVGNSLYATGQFSGAPGTSDKLRAVMTRIKASGAPQWTRSYLSPMTDTARLFGKRLTTVGNKIYGFGYGDLDGTSNSDVDLFFFRGSTSGNMDGVRYYDIVGAENERANEIYFGNNGFYMVGTYDMDGQRNVFVLRTNGSGGIQWAKGFGMEGDEESRGIIAVGGELWLAGTSNSFSESSDIFIAKLAPNGLVVPDACNFEQDLTVQVSTDLSPFQEDLMPIATNPIHTLDPAVPAEGSLLLGSNLYCDCIEYCNNLIDDDGDGLVDCDDPDCSGDPSCNTSCVFAPLHQFQTTFGGSANAFAAAAEGGFYTAGSGGETSLIGYIDPNLDSLVYGGTDYLFDLPESASYIFADPDSTAVVVIENDYSIHFHHRYLLKVDLANNNLIWSKQLKSNISGYNRGEISKILISPVNPQQYWILGQLS